jgi:hypothetical protein
MNIFKLTRRLPGPLRVDYRFYHDHSERELDIGYVSIYWSAPMRDRGGYAQDHRNFSVSFRDLGRVTGWIKGERYP